MEEGMDGEGDSGSEGMQRQSVKTSRGKVPARASV